MSIPAYPLQWPEGWRRFTPSLRTVAKFSTKRYSTYGYTEVSIAEGVARVRKELERFGVRDWNVVISSNIPLRMDGMPRSDSRNPDDPGVAVYWREEHNDKRRCIAVDRYTRAADNLAAIAATLDAMRAIERHGGAEILDRAFTGFVALAGPEPWFTVLGVPANAARDVIEAAYLRLRSSTHPDKGGSAEAFRRAQEAYQQGINRT